MSKQAKQERRRLRAAGMTPDLDRKRQESKAQDERRQQLIREELEKRAADPEKYDREDEQRRRDSKLRIGAFLGAAAALAASAPMVDLRPRGRSRYF